LDSGAIDRATTAATANTGSTDAALDGTVADAAQPPSNPTLPDANTAATNPADPCSRDELERRARAYFDAMASGDIAALELHPALRYTENGQEQQLGLGLWLNRPTVAFSRHVLDAQRCSSMTEAVLDQNLGQVIFGVRLRYVDGQLIDVEAQVVPQNPTYYNPEGIAPDGPDPWSMPVPPAMRMSEMALIQLASDYFDSIADPMRLPRSAADCVVRQNGVEVGKAGSCSVAPEGDRFEQVRFPVVDETLGVVSAIVQHRGTVGMLLFRAENGLLYNVEVIGGAYSQTTGW
jgi:hypothetical protein